MTFARSAFIFTLALAQATSLVSVAVSAATRITVPDGTAVDIAPKTLLATMASPKGSTFEATVKGTLSSADSSS